MPIPKSFLSVHVTIIMIVNVKSLMAVLMATILMLAVVIPITGAMASMSTEKGTADNEIGSGYLMTKAGSSSDRSTSSGLIITNSGGSVKLYVGDAEPVALGEGKAVFSDTFMVEGGASSFTLSSDQTIDLITGSDGAYMTISGGQWIYYASGSPRDVKEVKEVKEQMEVKEQKEGDGAKPTPDHYNGVYKYVFYPDDKGKWLNASAPVNVDTGSAVYVAYEGLLASGTLASMTILLPEPDPTEDSATCQYATSGDTNSLTAVNITLMEREREITSGIVVPLQYTDGEKMGMTGTLVSLIPVVMIVGVIIAAVSMMILRRQEDSL